MGSSPSKPAARTPEQLWPEPDPKPEEVLVPPLFDSPATAARTRMLLPGYELWFGKPALRVLFNDHFHRAGTVNAGLMLKLVEDPHVNLTATVSPAGGEAQLGWQRCFTGGLDNPDSFVDVLFKALRSSIYSPKYGLGAFASLPLPLENSKSSEENGIVGLRYASQNLSLGASCLPVLSSNEAPTVVPYGAWLVGRLGGFSAGAQYKPLSTPKGGSMQAFPFEDLKNWDYTISYGVGSANPLSPSFNFSLELLRSKKLVASFYQHQVVQRKVRWFDIDGKDDTKITNYIDFGLELATRVGKDKPTDDVDSSSLQIAANWQANKNFLVKGKLGPSKSSVALAFKSWWKPLFTFNITAVKDQSKGTTAYGFGIHVDDLRNQDSDSHLQS